jgi:hypothetical protein
MTLNTVLLAQAAIATVSAAPPGVTLGEWIAMVSCALVLAGVIYRSGQTAAATQGIERLVKSDLRAMKESLAKIDKHIEETQREKLQDARWQGDITVRVEAVEKFVEEDRRSGPPDRRHL